MKYSVRILVKHRLMGSHWATLTIETPMFRSLVIKHFFRLKRWASLRLNKIQYRVRVTLISSIMREWDPTIPRLIITKQLVVTWVVFTLIYKRFLNFNNQRISKNRSVRFLNRLLVRILKILYSLILAIVLIYKKDELIFRMLIRLIRRSMFTSISRIHLNSPRTNQRLNWAKN